MSRREGPAPSASRARPALPGLVVLFSAAVAMVTFYAVGRVDGPDPTDADFLWRPWPFLDEHALAIGVVSVTVLLLSGAALVAANQKERLPLFLVAQLAVLVVLAAWLGLAYGIVTDGVTGANIGGVGMLLLTPMVILFATALVVGLAVKGSRSKQADDGMVR